MELDRVLEIVGARRMAGPKIYELTYYSNVFNICSTLFNLRITRGKTRVLTDAKALKYGVNVYMS